MFFIIRYKNSLVSFYCDEVAICDIMSLSNDRKEVQNVIDYTRKLSKYNYCLFYK